MCVVAKQAEKCGCVNSFITEHVCAQLTLMDGGGPKSKLIDLSLSSSALCCRIWSRPLRLVGIDSDLIMETRVDLRLPGPDCIVNMWSDIRERKWYENKPKLSSQKFTASVSYLVWTFRAATFVRFINQMLKWCVHGFSNINWNKKNVRPTEITFRFGCDWILGSKNYNYEYTMHTQMLLLLLWIRSDAVQCSRRQTTWFFSVW